MTDASTAAAAPVQIAVDKGQPVRVMKVHEHLSIGTMPWGRLSRIVPDPRRAEDPKALQYASAADREQAEIRNEVQRMINRTKKGENAGDYARYIARGLRGQLGPGWTTPPFALWIPNDLEHVAAQGPFGEDVIAYLPFDVNGVLVDAETQHLAHVLLAEAPQVYGMTKEQVSNRTIAVEIYHGIDLAAARQIFHDRNLLGVIPNKTVALNSDSRDIATGIAVSIMEGVVVEHPRTRIDVPLKTLVSVNKRQLGAKDDEWMTLSTLRSFVVTALFGRAGIEMTSAAVTPEAIPTGLKEEDARDEIVHVAGVLFQAFQSQFANRTSTVIAAPAVLASLGAVAHRSLSWTTGARRPHADLVQMLSSVNWSRDPHAWDGIAGKATASGRLSLAGGVKDNGSKTATALEDSTSHAYHRIRGLA
ncbi:DNA sulfur modification protein DndB [Actinopolymorpha pittospori]|uniref:DNA-sulfur modification-associated n=1 Tax=Actinopolymorpha pittospori TaxID=648752 RepID=A0A927MS70_9ACTN|nr:DNA sulfur modification protein DndB [Actinopolymorpha pittospori]MBE1604268.1 hypothetical protein [Actinopolymorpha pittospori]